MTAVVTVPAPRAEVPDARDPWVRLVQLSQAEPAGLAEGGGVAAARVRVGGVDAVAFATDGRVQGGAIGAEGAATIVRAYDAALAHGVPIVGIWQSGGARLREGVASLHGIGLIFTAMTQASGHVPQVSLVLGPAAGGAAYGPALTDVVVMAPDARVFVTGPDVIRTVLGEDVTSEQLGGPRTHANSGVAHLVETSLEAAYQQVHEVVSLLAAQDRPATVGGRPDPGQFVPDSPRQAYDVLPVVGAILDGPPVELQAAWAPTVVTALGRLAGRTVGVVANQPYRLAGCLTAESSDKAARFVRLCDAFGIPLLFAVDVPGYLPGRTQEDSGIVRRGAKLLHAVAAAKVPRATVILRKSYGGAFIAMNSKSLGATAVYAWPGAQVDVMSSVAAVQVLKRREIAAAGGDPEVVARFAAEHEVTTGGLSRATAEGYVDAVIETADTRRLLIEVLCGADVPKAAFGNIPL
jgi:acetyl-CoA/propionyl-CoA carboxylase carboxyl transferase subunit